MTDREAIAQLAEMVAENMQRVQADLSEAHPATFFLSFAEDLRAPREDKGALSHNPHEMFEPPNLSEAYREPAPAPEGEAGSALNCFACQREADELTNLLCDQCYGTMRGHVHACREAYYLSGGAMPVCLLQPQPDPGSRGCWYGCPYAEYDAWDLCAARGLSEELWLIGEAAAAPEPEGECPHYLPPGGATDTHRCEMVEMEMGPQSLCVMGSDPHPRRAGSVRAGRRGSVGA
jgi:hypothetical protein